MSSTFTIKAGPGTDIWRKPPSKNIFNAPTFAPAGTNTTAKLGSFSSATVSFAFVPKELYDQGGVVLSLNPPGGNPAGKDAPPAKWIKSGVELLDGKPVLGTVACDSWADWSLTPVPDSSVFLADKKGFTTVTLEKGGDENGVSLWVYQVSGEGQKLPLREICWVFEPGSEDWTVEVAAYAARPAKGTSEELLVEFKELDVKWG